MGKKNAYSNSIRQLPAEDVFLIIVKCGGRCWICQRPFSPTDDNQLVRRGGMHFCHELDKQFGGGAAVDNAVIMCPNCHSDETVRVPCGRAFSRSQNVVCPVRVAGQMGRASAGNH
jgi:5-methylcytosine-specific restriction endonuclease McrA